MSEKLIALIPARSGSKRVKNKNIRKLNGYPLIAYTISSCLQAGIFNRVIVSTDSKEIASIALSYGAEVPFLRPESLSGTYSPDISWIKHALDFLEEDPHAFAIMRPTSPFRKPKLLREAWKNFQANKGIDSFRAVELCKQHPGKMWTINNGLITPLLSQEQLEIPYHSRQYQDLPEVYVQNSSLEIVRTKAVRETNLHAGKKIAPIFTDKIFGFSIDYEEDFLLAEIMISNGLAELPSVEKFIINSAT